MGSILSALFGGVGGAADGDDSSAELSAVIAFHSSNRWQLHYNSVRATNQLLVVDFSASWCAPCKLIEPAFNAMATQFPDVSFAKIDVDELPGCHSSCKERIERLEIYHHGRNKRKGMKVKLSSSCDRTVHSLIASGWFSLIV